MANAAVAIRHLPDGDGPEPDIQPCRSVRCFIMAKFQAVPMRDTFRPMRWTIEKVTPGDPPVRLPFYGTKAEAAAEAHRLNLYGGDPAQSPSASRRQVNTRRAAPANEG
jgi:hypothetical protein